MVRRGSARCRWRGRWSFITRSVLPRRAWPKPVTRPEVRLVRGHPCPPLVHGAQNELAIRPLPAPSQEAPAPSPAIHALPASPLTAKRAYATLSGEGGACPASRRLTSESLSERRARMPADLKDASRRGRLNLGNCAYRASLPASGTQLGVGSAETSAPPPLRRERGVGWSRPTPTAAAAPSAPSRSPTSRCARPAPCLATTGRGTHRHGRSGTSQSSTPPSPGAAVAT